MKKVLNETATLKLTVAEDGNVWYLDGAHLPLSSGVNPGLFLRSPLLRNAGRVRVVGSVANAGLIVDLYERRCQGAISTLEVCSPLVCESAEGRRDPELTLYYMRTFGLPSSLGGWHEVEEADFLAYSIAHFLRQDPEVTPHILSLAEQHPVWNALTFINGLVPEEAARLIGLVLDPRWYIDQDAPDRLSRLEQYLGLTPKTMQAVASQQASTWLHDRCRVVLKSWAGPLGVIGPAAGKSTDYPGLKMLDDPRNFLQRIRLARGGGVKGDLGASKHFVSYLRHNWLNETASAVMRGRLFVPEHFFERPDEVEAYKDHMRLVKRTVK